MRCCLDPCRTVALSSSITLAASALLMAYSISSASRLASNLDATRLVIGRTPLSLSFGIEMRPCGIATSPEAATSQAMFVSSSRQIAIPLANPQTRTDAQCTERGSSMRAIAVISRCSNSLSPRSPDASATPGASILAPNRKRPGHCRSRSHSWRPPPIPFQTPATPTSTAAFGSTLLTIAMPPTLRGWIE